MTLPASYLKASGDDTLETWRRYVRTRDLKDRDILFDRYIGLVHHTAREAARRLSTTLEVDDLISAGTLGLIQAMASYDPERGTTFSTWAMPRIKGSIIDEVRSWDWVPRSIRDRNRDASRTLDQLRQRLGREPDSSEVADALGIELDAWWRQSAHLSGPVLVSLNGTSGTDEAGAPDLAETISDPRHVDASRRLESSEDQAALAEAFDAMAERDRLVLSLSYLERLTLKQIADILKITESRVSQIRTRALARLRERMSETNRLAA